MKKQITLIAFSILLNSLHVKSQTPDWTWTKLAPCAAPTGQGEGWAMASDAAGNFYIGGFFSNSAIIFGNIVVDTTAVLSGNTYGYFIAKYDSSGNPVWAKNICDAGFCGVESMATDPSGNLYITGSIGIIPAVFGNDTIYPSGMSDLLVAKFDSSGNLLWVRVAQSPRIEPKSLTADAAGNIYITGFFSTSVTFDSLTITDSGNGDILIVKYDSAGQVIWVKTTGGPEVECAFSIAADLTGNIFITGNFSSQSVIIGPDTLIKANSNFESADIFIAKYDSSGQALWARKADGISSMSDHYNWPAAVTPGKTGNVYFTGVFESDTLKLGAFTLPPMGFWGTTFISKLDSTGNILWAKAFADYNPYNLIADDKENLIFTARRVGDVTWGGTTYPALLCPDCDPFLIASCDSAGNPLWAKILTNGAEDIAPIAFGLNGSIYVSGDFMPQGTQTVIVGNDTLITVGGEEIFVARLDFPSTISIPEISGDEKIVLFPNPFTGELNVIAKGNELLQVTLYDILSRQLIRENFTYTTTLSTSQLANGIYIYEIRNATQLLKKGKVIKH